MKPISIRFTEEELAEVDQKAKKANLSRSEYIRYNIITGNSVQVIDKGKKFYQSLVKINEAICEVENKPTKLNCDIIRKEVLAACQELSL